jgi:hypothetical protein
MKVKNRAILIEFLVVLGELGCFEWNVIRCESEAVDAGGCQDGHESSGEASYID